MIYTWLVAKMVLQMVADDPFFSCWLGALYRTAKVKTQLDEVDF